MQKTICLREMHVGESKTIASIGASGEMGRRIRDMGLIPGTDLKVLGRAPLRDPVAVQVWGCVITLRNNEADFILLQ